MTQIPVCRVEDIAFYLLSQFYVPEYGCDRLTVLSGGTVNGLFLREKLFDYVDLVVAPVKSK